MDEFSTTIDTLDQTDEGILTPTVSDEALEAAAIGRREAEASTQLGDLGCITLQPMTVCRYGGGCSGH
jgi:hypothetical protein